MRLVWLCSHSHWSLYAKIVCSYGSSQWLLGSKYGHNIVILVVLKSVIALGLINPHAMVDRTRF